MPQLQHDLTYRLDIAHVNDLRAWLRIARPGDRAIYHQGFLVVDRGATSSLRERERRRLDALATAVCAAASAGLVHLLQKRLDVVTFDYLAVKARQDLAGRQI